MQSSFFAHFMCFEVPALVPPGGHANGSRTGSYDEDANDDDLGIMDIDESDSKASNSFFLSSFFKFKLVYICHKVMLLLSQAEITE